MNKNVKDIIVLLIAVLLAAAVFAGTYYSAKFSEGTVITNDHQGTPGHPAM